MGLIKIKVIVIALLLTIIHQGAKAQTYAEFFRQKKTQERYLAKQLIFLKTYAAYIRDGYKIVDKGLSTFKDLTKGEFKLHEAFLTGLKVVNYAVKQDPRVAESLVYLSNIIGLFQEIRKVKNLSDESQRYVSEVTDLLRTECEKDLDMLLLVITSGKLEMSDDERLQKLDDVYEAIKDKSEFLQDFGAQVRLMSSQARREAESIKHLKKLYEND